MLVMTRVVYCAKRFFFVKIAYKTFSYFLDVFFASYNELWTVSVKMGRCFTVIMYKKIEVAVKNDSKFRI